MILTKEINIKITRGNIIFFKKRYKIIKIDDILNIPVENLSKNSELKIIAKCDICGRELETTYFNYNRNFNKGNIYTCKKCSREKIKKTCLEKYGVEHASQNTTVKDKIKQSISKKSNAEQKEIIKKRKNTTFLKYGVENISQSEKIKEKIKKTCLEKYGVEHACQNDTVKDKIKQTNFKKYDFKTPLKNEKIKEKIKKTCLEKYGVEIASKNEEIKEKMINTNLEKYGFNSPLQNKIIHNKSKETLLNNYNVTHQSQSEIIQERIKNNKKEKYKNKYSDFNISKIENDVLTIKCDKCNNEYSISKLMLYNRLKLNTITCTICNPIGSEKSSGQEILLSEFISKNCNYEIIKNRRNIIQPYELDIYLPELKLAFEYNGLFWHNELYKEKNHHKIKSGLCEEKSIQLIHIWEDEWLYKQEIVKSMILNKLGNTINKLFARKCEIKEVDSKTTTKFLENNHIQGAVGSAIKIGLFFNSELVSLMTFGKKRLFMKSSSNAGEYELLRFCNKLNTSVIGGASRLFKYFLNTYQPKEIITYADRSYSNGNLYKQLGFQFVHKTEPDYYYVIDGIRKHRFGFRKDVLIKEGFDKNKTEHEIMLERNIFRIYNSGNLKFSYKNI